VDLWRALAESTGRRFENGSQRIERGEQRQKDVKWRERTQTPVANNGLNVFSSEKRTQNELDFEPKKVKKRRIQGSEFGFQEQNRAAGGVAGSRKTDAAGAPSAHRKNAARCVRITI